MPRKIRLRDLLVLILAGSVASCSTRRAYTEWVARQPEPVCLNCPAANAAPSLEFPARLELGSIRAGSELTGYAGDINQMPDSILVPFCADAPPLAVLKTDLERMLATQRSPVLSEGEPPRYQLEVTLQTAFVDRTFHVWKSSEMRGRVVLVAAIVDVRAARTNWVKRISAEHRVAPGYIASRSVEAALAGGYCEALSALQQALHSPEARAAMPP